MSTPLIQTALTYSMLVTYRVVNEQQEKKYIRQTFSKFVSKSVVDELLKDPSKIKLGGDTLISEGVKTLNALAEKIDTDKMKAPSFKMILTGVGKYAYQQKDGIFIVPIGCLKN